MGETGINHTQIKVLLKEQMQRERGAQAVMLGGGRAYGPRREWESRRPVSGVAWG